jgi:4a-hydroxytetrahydrobiopterin dehydratase
MTEPPDGWELKDKEIVKLYKFNDFKEALAFVNRVGALAEEADHHPDIDIRWNKVTLTLSTHSAGGLTDKDFALARAIDLLDVQHDEPGRRFFIALPDGSEAQLLYKKEGEALNFFRTYVPEASREKGLAEKLVTAGFRYAQAHSLKVIPTCSYVAATFLSRHPDLLPLVKNP